VCQPLRRIFFLLQHWLKFASFLVLSPICFFIYLLYIQTRETIFFCIKTIFRTRPCPIDVSSSTRFCFWAHSFWEARCQERSSPCPEPRGSATRLVRISDAAFTDLEISTARRCCRWLKPLSSFFPGKPVDAPPPLILFCHR